MPSITSVSPPCGRKRRRDDFSTSIEVQKKLSSPHLQRYSHIPEPTTTLNTEFNNNLTYNRRLLIPKVGRNDLKRQRVDTSDTVVESPYLTREPPVLDFGHTLTKQGHDSTDRIVTVQKSKVDLNPCHICRRKPTVKSELDAFADCEGCANRTCYICIRECLSLGVEDRKVTEQALEVLNFSLHGTGDGMDMGGTNTIELANPDSALGCGDNLDMGRTWEKSRAPAHKRMICSRCCVERGTEGEVWCFGCLGTEGPG